MFQVADIWNNKAKAKPKDRTTNTRVVIKQ